MPFVKKEILNRLLKDEQNWLELLHEREAEARGLGYETAQIALESQVSSANQLTADANARIDELERELANARLQLDAKKGAVRAIGSQIRREALQMAAGVTSVENVVIRAQEFETYLRGEGPTTAAYEIKLVNSGWNSALEYLAAEIRENTHNLGSTIGAEENREWFVSFLGTLKREA